MQKNVMTLIMCLALAQTYGQQQRKVATYLFTQYSKTMYDRTLGNNPWSLGLGLQTCFKNATRFTPMAEVTGDIYFEDDKVLRVNTDGTMIKDLGGMVNLFVGTAFSPAQNIYLSVVAGPSFIDGQTLLGIKPSIGCYFSTNRVWTAKLSYINVFNRGQTIKEDFGSVSVAIGVQLF